MNAPLSELNHILHTGLKLKTINDETKCFYKQFKNRLGINTNHLILNPASDTIPSNPLRRMKYKWCRDFLSDSITKKEIRNKITSN